MSEKILAITSHLTESERKLFLGVYHNHYSGMGLNEKLEYKLDNIVEIKRNTIEKCLEVYFSNGEWFKYFMDGSWG